MRFDTSPGHNHNFIYLLSLDLLARDASAGLFLLGGFALKFYLKFF